MPLSEQEQRLLDEMERNLYRNDADFVSTVGNRKGRPSYRNIAIGCVITIVGAGALIAGVILQQPIIGIIGFAAMLAGVMFAISPGKGEATSEPQSPFPASGKRSQSAASPSFMDRMNHRWDKRQDEN
ncbi:DUF3040 domain-containing protein [Mycetocola zhujimingii]|uniref:DUF3040 domain-containing protein n=1 Tax=Mycetocola zhujimingii TaxID=2079792 RepID=A0A2U1TI68_9MICO|nr:DUF3040 domain-containing protein [Mycetocola zhujimingii]AWB86282.1 hypothetical protein C3E77_06425 [Mycetocola zhujimingii]PWC08587.1 DUF3040 domain-containing protein [Mycetocola zhujimingii]